MKNWKPIESAPTDKPVWLRAPNVQPVVMCWSDRRQMWVGAAGSSVGPVLAFWDTTFCEPTEWAEAE